MAEPAPEVTAHRLLERVLAEPAEDALAALLGWLLEESPVAFDGSSPRNERLALLDQALRAHPRQAELLERLRAAWTHGSVVRLLAETGLPVHSTLFKESFERLVDQVAPRLAPEDDLFVLVTRLPLTPPDAEWIEGLDPATLAPWAPLVALPDRALLDAARLLAIRAASLGLGRDLLELFPGEPESASPFFTLQGEVERLAAEPHDAERYAAWLDTLARARARLRDAEDRLERRGVTTDIIFRLELLEAQLARLELLLAVATGRGDGRHLAAAIVRGAIRQRGVRSLAHNSLKRLARKVTEHTAETGEHYQVATARDWDDTSWSAAGGGVVTALTAFGKYAIGGLPLSPLVAGVAYSVNYTASFVTLQLAHFTLASKQPAMTGAALAEALERGVGDGAEVETVARITRSQVAATLGNVLTTMPVTAGLALLVWWLTGAAPLGAESAEHTVHGMHPFRSLTIPYAIVTGVMLWLASLAAGWAGNWSGFRGLPEALARHARLRRLLGPERAQAIGRFTARHLSGIAGYTALGFLLGMVPVVFQFAGVPLEVRHVTLHAASLALAAASLYGTPLFSWAAVGWGMLGILVIAVCNIGVSFGLALRTAVRARDLNPAERRRLWRELGRAFRADPKRFLWRPT
jgi:site-specific recombinase